MSLSTLKNSSTASLSLTCLQVHPLPLESCPSAADFRTPNHSIGGDCIEDKVLREEEEEEDYKSSKTAEGHCVAGAKKESSSSSSPSAPDHDATRTASPLPLIILTKHSGEQTNRRFERKRMVIVIIREHCYESDDLTRQLLVYLHELMSLTLTSQAQDCHIQNRPPQPYSLLLSYDSFIWNN